MDAEDASKILLKMSGQTSGKEFPVKTTINQAKPKQRQKLKQKAAGTHKYEDKNQYKFIFRHNTKSQL